jgi:hypothetical protein
MAVLKTSFDRYSITYIGGNELNDGAPGAIIDCYLSSKKVGCLSFFIDGRTIPDNNQMVDGAYALNFEMHRFTDIMTMFKSTKPLLLVLNTETWYGYVATASMQFI